MKEQQKFKIGTLVKNSNNLTLSSIGIILSHDSENRWFPYEVYWFSERYKKSRYFAGDMLVEIGKEIDEE